MSSLSPAVMVDPRRAAVVTEAVRLIEETGALDDDAALRAAHAAETTLPRRVASRAGLLGRRIGLDAEIDRFGHWAPWIGLAGVMLIAQRLLWVTWRSVASWPAGSRWMNGSPA